MSQKIENSAGTNFKSYSGEPPACKIHPLGESSLIVQQVIY